MILRLSTKLATKLKVTPFTVLPLDENPLGDWSGHVFMSERMQYAIVTNTASLYSTIFHGRDASGDSQFIERALGTLREFMAEDGLSFIYERFIAPSSRTVQLSKALNRSVTSSMNDLIVHAKIWLRAGQVSPRDTALRLNNIPFASLRFQSPRELISELACLGNN